MLFIAEILSLQACRSETGPATITRAADAVYASADGESISTADYPRVELGGQTRVIATWPGSFGNTRVHARVELEVGANSTLEIAYGLGPGVPAGSKVTFTIYVSDSEGRDLTHSAEVVASSETSWIWIEDSVLLGGWTGRLEIELQSYVAGYVGDEVYIAMPIVAEPGVSDRRPNLLLISLDTLRADHLGVYGYARDTSPNIDRRFGRNGLVVEQVFSQASDTVLGHTAMLLGKRPCAGIAPAGGNAWWQNPQAVALAEHLQSAGYRTAAFTEDAMVAGSWGFARGFDIYDEEKNAERKGVIDNEPPGFIRQTFDRGIAWLEENRDDRFFVFLQTYEVHAPYTPAQEHARLFSSADAADAPGHDRDLYDAEIHYADAEVERLMRELERLEVLDNTIVVITSDHGEEFDEHGGRYHGWQVYDEVIRVPLLIAGPGVPGGGVRRPGPVALIDMLPTLLDLLDVERSAAATARRYFGCRASAHWFAA